MQIEAGTISWPFNAYIPSTVSHPGGWRCGRYGSLQLNIGLTLWGETACDHTSELGGRTTIANNPKYPDERLRRGVRDRNTDFVRGVIKGTWML